jgi:hypothetical protein
MAVALLAALAAFSMAGGASSPPGCRADGPLVRLAELPEASGVAASRTVAGRLWAHNDSGAVLFALDTRGAVIDRVPLTGIRVRDWEALAAARCGAASCLYLGDIGDNGAVRADIAVYRVPEPGPNAARAPEAPRVLRGRYPDGPQDAETLLVTGDGGLFVVTKGSTGPIALYRFPRQPGREDVVTLERVGQPRTPGKVARDERITDGSVSPDGTWVVLRTHRTLLVHPAARLLAGDWGGEQAVDVTALGEPQGEGVTVDADGSLYLVGEGGGKARPGTFAHVTCRPPLSTSPDAPRRGRGRLRPSGS